MAAGTTATFDNFTNGAVLQITSGLYLGGGATLTLDLQATPAYWNGGVLGGLVEVDEAIDDFGGADPFVDCLAHGFFGAQFIELENDSGVGRRSKHAFHGGFSAES